MSTNLLKCVLEAQTHNSNLSGDELMSAAIALARIARLRRFAVLPSDQAGERILGAALALEEAIEPADRSCRFDRQRVLLVAGYIAGDASVSSRASAARALGAENVDVALLTPWPDRIEGCDQIWCLGTPSPLMSAASA